METALQMFKVDLGILHDKRDEYFKNLLTSTCTELSDRGIKLDLSSIKDSMLLSDYSAWVYRKRTENLPMSQNLQLRIRNKQVKGRALNG